MSVCSSKAHMGSCVLLPSSQELDDYIRYMDLMLQLSGSTPLILEMDANVYSRL